MEGTLRQAWLAVARVTNRQTWYVNTNQLPRSSQVSENWGVNNALAPYLVGLVWFWSVSWYLAEV